MKSTIMRIMIIILCVAGIAVVAVLSFKSERRMTSTFRKTEVDFSQYTNTKQIFEKGKEYLDSAVNDEFMNVSGIDKQKIIQKYVLAIEHFREVLSRNETDAEAMTYAGIADGMIAKNESDTSKIIKKMNTSFNYLDRAIKLKKDYYFAYYWRGVFSVETPNAIFNRLNKGISDLYYVINHKKQAKFLLDGNYLDYLRFYLGKGLLKAGNKAGRKFIQLVFDTTDNQKLKNMSKESLSE